MENSIKFVAKLILITSVFNLLACKSKSEPLVIVSKNYTCDDGAFYQETRTQEFIKIFTHYDKTTFSLNNYQYTRGDLLENGKVYLRADSKNPPVSTFYLSHNNELIELLCFEKGAEFIRDSIVDVNGDHFLDVVVQHRMGGNLYSKVFLQDSETNTFHIIHDLPNPIFDATEKTARGFIKQQSPIAHFYKLRFNQLKIDTIESIFYNTKEINPIYIRTKSRNPFIPNVNGEYSFEIKNKEEILQNLPLEYKVVDRLLFE